jgi:hypothetical protein
MSKDNMVMGGIIAVIVVGLVGVFILGNSGQTPKTATTGEVISEAGVHWHPTLELVLKGQKTAIPKNIGLSGGEMKVHTHDDLPLIHYEYSNGPVTKDMAKLGVFFTTWGKKFSSSQLLDTPGVVSMTVNGKDNKDLENYIVKDNDKIVIRVD